MYTIRIFRIYIILAAAILAIVLQASYFNDTTIYTVATEVTEDGDVIQKPKLVSVKEHRKRAEADGPRVRVDNPVFDFGRLEPLTTHQHTFVIHNHGTEPLELRKGPTTCKCTVATLKNGAVPPGGKVGVLMQWNTGRDPVYSHTATIYTNDPRKKVVTLKIKGRVEVLLRCQPERLVFSRVEQGKTPSASTIVYSQAWEQFDISQVSPSLPGLECSIEETTPDERRMVGANAAHRLTVTLPPDLPEGYFTIPVEITARHTGSAKGSEERPGTVTAEQASGRGKCKLTVNGKILRRLCVHGPDIDTQGAIMMGRVPEGKGARVKLLLKLRDEQKELRVRSIETLPKSLDARLVPYQVDGKKELGLYHLYVELPKEAPAFRLPPGKQGYVRIDFDHPRVPRLDLAVDLIVSPRSTPAF
ncbi:MAG: DUF1573 domain-containing protein [bacterium]